MNDDQSRTVAYLSSPDAFDGTGPVEVVETDVEAVPDGRAVLGIEGVLDGGVRAVVVPCERHVEFGHVLPVGRVADDGDAVALIVGHHADEALGGVLRGVEFALPGAVTDGVAHRP